MSAASRPLSFVSLVGIFMAATATGLHAAEMRFHPVAATDNVICLPGEGACGETEIILSDGGVTVTLFLEFGGWDPAMVGDPTLLAVAGTMDSDTLQGGGASNPGTLEGLDLVPVGHPDMGFEGAFQSLTVCGDMFDPTDFDPLMPCQSIADCPSGIFCIDRPDYIFYKLDNTPGVYIADWGYSWQAMSYGCPTAPDSGATKLYFGTLLLEVQSGTTGTYNVDFIEILDFTLWNPCPGGGPYLPQMTPGQITIMPNANDCDDNGVPDMWDPDGDGDGVIDACDGCPDDADKIEPGVCGCGIDDELDGDADGVPDCIDQCPNVDDELFAPECVDKIPTVSMWGLIIMALLLLAAGKVLFGGRLVRK